MDQSLGNYDQFVKIIVVGDQAVGKTCLLLSISGEEFATNHIATIGLDFKVKNLQVNDRLVKLQIWDTAGQERFKNITQAYYKGAMGIILVYDCTNRSSFDHVKDWADQIMNHANPDVVKVLVANKVDLETKRNVSTDDGLKLASELNVEYFETSAKTRENITHTFTRLAALILESGLCEKYGYKSVLPKKNKRKTCCQS